MRRITRKSPLKRSPLKRGKRAVYGDSGVSTDCQSGLTGLYLKSYSSLIELYTEIWNERDRISYISGLPIPFFNLSNFAHVLAKGQGRYPKFKYYKKNIVLLLPEEHHLYDNGHSGLRENYTKKYPACDWSKLDTLKAELLEEYKLSEL
jgi:hypothetical protein